MGAPPPEPLPPGRRPRCGGARHGVDSRGNHRLLAAHRGTRFAGRRCVISGRRVISSAHRRRRRYLTCVCIRGDGAAGDELITQSHRQGVVDRG
eukprot:COSAG01_NODE_39751_length_472_cov_1.916890_1_plen_93_part_10